jgi:hypothetical protein
MIGVRDVVDWLIEVGVIEQVKELYAKAEARSLPDLYSLHHGKVRIEEVRPTERLRLWLYAGHDLNHLAQAEKIAKQKS